MIKNNKKTTKLWLILFLFLFFSILLIYFFLFKREKFPEYIYSNQTLLLFLWYINILFILILLFVMIRQFVKLILERKAKILGFRLKTKLIISLMALVICPVIFLFIFAMDLFFQASQFPEDIPKVFSYGEEIIKEWDKNELKSIYSFLDEILRSFKENEEKYWFEEGKKFCKSPEIFFQIFKEKKFLFSINCQLKSEPSLPNYDFLREIDENGKGFYWNKEKGSWSLRAGKPFKKNKISYQILAGKIYPDEIGKNREKFLESSIKIKEFNYQKKNLDLTRILIFLLLTLSIAFAAIWIGTYLSKYFTNPLSQFLEGTKEVARGNLDYKLPNQEMEDWNLLFIYFNYMVNEIKNYRELLAKEREYLKALVENLTLGILNISYEGKILTANKRAKELLNILEENLNFFEKINYDFPSLHKWLLERKKEKLNKFEIFELKGGSVNLSISFVPFSRESFLLIIEDITELIKAQRMGTWKEVAQKIAHEIKNPLTPIQLFSEHIRKKTEEGKLSKEELLSSLNAIIEEVNNLKKMVDSFSQFARMPMPVIKKLNLRELFFQLKDLYNNLHPKLQFELNIKEDFPEINADRELLRRALVNLIDNAVEALKFEGKVSLSAEIEEGNVKIIVADEGPGIPEEIKPNIFKPYVSTKGRGSGMGLSVVERVVKDHGGIITFEDNIPKGTKFIILLPYY